MRSEDQISDEARPAELLDRVQELSTRVDGLADARARELAHELVGAVIAMYGDGLQRIIEVIESSREAGATILDELAQDGVVASLLLIHDLYPVSLQERVIEALDTVRPYMESHGGNVELLGIEEGVARLAMQGSCNGCAASRATLELAIKQALDEHAPDLAGLEVEGISEPASNGHRLPGAESAGAFELPVVHHGELELPLGGSGGDAHVEHQPRWIPLQAAGLEPGEVRVQDADGVALLLARVDGSLLAYRDECASCGGPLHGGELAGRMLRCPSCEVEFDLPRAGRAAGGEPLQLTPVPLLEHGGLRVAV
jgi:Fe-S cluster biogenesis protein NfuA/nitrite reductase/ring-hydroxylating ferredoxin subunit